MANTNKSILSSGRVVLTGLVILVFAVLGTAYGQVDNLDNLGKMVIMEEGRLKPLDTFSANILKQFSGQSRFEKGPALGWLARVLFSPQVSHEDKVFLITNPDVLDSMGVVRVGKARNRYSFTQLRGGLIKLREMAFSVSKIEGKDRSFIENEIISLYNKLYIYQQLLSTFDYVFPQASLKVTQPETREMLGLPGGQEDFSFIDLAAKKAAINEFSKLFKSKNREEWTAAEQEIAGLSAQLDRMPRTHRELSFAVLPPLGKMTGKVEKWLSPWDKMTAVLAHGGTVLPGELIASRDFVLAYGEKDQAKFDQALIAFNQGVIDKSSERVRPKAVSMEIFYNRIDPFYKGKFFYGFSIIFMLLSFVALRKWFYRLSFLLLALGFLLHLFGTIARMYIMLRPPVTNLYETFVFTGLITVLLGMVLEFFKKKNIGIFTGGLAGLVMLMIAGKYAMEGDTMGMLVAVLDSNFWLASHVITIILGYAGIVLSGFIGHLYLLQKIFRPGNKELLKNTFQSLYAIQAFGLIFTFLGTVLGGIWADQSWGRFWGWDPKENGALLILLWSAILFHAKLAKWIKETGMAMGSIVGVIAVSLAWFGVNLLGVGLHSYGFTTGVALSLFAFITFESLFIVATFLKLNLGKQPLKETTN